MRLATREPAFQRAERLMALYLSLPNSADIEFRIGKTQGGEPAVMVTCDKQDFPFWGAELEKMIAVFQSTVDKFGDTAREEGITTLLNGFKEATKAARAAA
jgi:hypothetical protein